VLSSTKPKQRCLVATCIVDKQIRELVPVISMVEVVDTKSWLAAVVIDNGNKLVQ
jgi:hypothetical protein